MNIFARIAQMESSRIVGGRAQTQALLRAPNLTSRAGATGISHQPGSRGKGKQYNSRAETLSLEQIKCLISYDPNSGIFTRKTGYRSGLIAGYKDKLGYVRLTVCGIEIRAHRLAWLFVNGQWPSFDIDHIDHDPSNNAITNLREATVSQNAQNARNKGYTRQSRGSGFLARIKVNDKVLCLGTYPTEQEARSAYVAASLKYFGEFSAFHQGWLK